MRIDVHNHTFPESVAALVSSDERFGMTVEGGLVKGARSGDHEFFPELYDPAAKLAQLERRELEGAVICLEPNIFVYHLDPDLGDAMAEAANRGLSELCAASPERLHWMAHTPLQDPARSAVVLRQAAAAGAVGVAVGSSIAGRRLDEPEFEPFWQAVEETRLTVFVHNAYNTKIRGLDQFHLGNVIGNPVETTICAARLIAAGTLDAHPHARIVLAHAGGFFPYQAGRLRHAKTVRDELVNSPADPWAYAGQLVFDTITHDVATLAFLVSRAGAENVVVGTDLPYDMSTPEPMKELRAAVDEQTVKLIAEDNPARLFRL